MVIFNCASQLVFKVKVNGRDMLVSFSDSGTAVSQFATENSDVAAAIRRHKFYREGRISEETVPGNGVDTSLAGKETSASAENSAAEEEGDVMEFPNFTALKEWMKKEYPEIAGRLRSRDVVMKTASDLGLRFRIVEPK